MRLVLALLFLASPAFAGDISVEDAYARSNGPSAKVGAIFMEIRNSGAAPDRLVAVQSDAARRVELHTHLEDTATGVMRMVAVEDGFEVPASGLRKLQRGGDHIMLMGLTGPLEEGGEVSVTLIFEQAGEMTVSVPVDLQRRPAGHGHKHSN